MKFLTIRNTSLRALLAITLIIATRSSAQIFGPEGMNIPGAFNGWSNPPSVNAFAGIQKAGGTFLVDTLLQMRMYRTAIHVAPSGADAVGGTYNYLFTSGPVGNYYQNKWNQTSTILDSVQSYTYSTGPGGDNNITITNNRYYTVNVADNGYASTQAIWIETASPPVNILSVQQSPTGPTVTPSTPVTVSIRTGGAPTASENFYVRYSIDNFATSTLAPVTFVSSDSGTAGLPGFPGGETVKYYAFSTPFADPATHLELKSLRYNAGPGGQGYSYVVFAPFLTISASAGLNGSITPSGNVQVASGAGQAFSITADPGYFIDSVIVDNVFAGSMGTYTFTNVVSNHTIRAVFSRNVAVTFRVDMRVLTGRGLFEPSSDSVWVRGSFNGWGTSLLADPDLDTVYTGTIPIEQFSPLSFKYFKTLRGGLEWEDNVANRTVLLGVSDTTLPVVYFDDRFPLYNVTFQIDMRKQLLRGSFRPDSGDVLTVRGNFNDWGNSTNNPDTLTDGNSDSVYIRTIAISGNQELQYKFWKTLRSGFDYEAGENRSFLLGLQNELIPPVEFKESVVMVTVGNRWNLVSVPVSAAPNTTTALFPSSTSEAFAFEGVYLQKDTLEPGKGYWLKFDGAQSLEIIGEPIVADTIDVTEGWNLIGAPGVELPVASIASVPAGIITSPFYGYEGGYAVSSVLRQGKGYWVKVNGSGQLLIDTAAAMKPESGIGDLLRQLSRFTIADASGNSQSLFLDCNDGAVERSELPPSPPAGVFDARFTSGRMVEGSAESGHEVRVSSAEYPLTISWEMKGSDAWVLTAGERSMLMQTPGSVRVLSPADAIMIHPSHAAGVPTEFTLEQNYPNPFNPVTMIRYSLPVMSHVSLRIFNAIGQEVAAVVEGVQDAGAHSVRWDAGTASGVFFARLTAKSVDGRIYSGHLTRKMLILR